MQKVELKPKKNGRVGQFLRKFAEIVIAGGPYYIQPLWIVRNFKQNYFFAKSERWNKTRVGFE